MKKHHFKGGGGEGRAAPPPSSWAVTGPIDRGNTNPTASGKFLRAYQLIIPEVTCSQFWSEAWKFDIKQKEAAVLLAT